MKQARIIRNLGVSLLGLVLASGASADGYKVPRLANGQPDLQGVWTNSRLT